jgi:hypothetical protein
MIFVYVILSILQDLFYSQSTHTFYKEELIEMTDTNQVIDSNLYYFLERFFSREKIMVNQFSYNITILQKTNSHIGQAKNLPKTNLRLLETARALGIAMLLHYTAP